MGNPTESPRKEVICFSGRAGRYVRAALRSRHYLSGSQLEAADQERQTCEALWDELSHGEKRQARATLAEFPYSGSAEHSTGTQCVKPSAPQRAR